MPLAGVGTHHSGRQPPGHTCTLLPCCKGRGPHLLLRRLQWRSASARHSFRRSCRCRRFLLLPDSIDAPLQDADGHLQPTTQHEVAAMM